MEDTASIPTSDTKVPRTWTTTVAEDGTISLPDELWNAPMLADHSRFDWVVLPEGGLLLRPCPHTEAGFRAENTITPDGQPVGHSGDGEWTDGSHCGLTKWTCAGCGGSTLVEHIDAFPPHWLEINELDGRLKTLSTAVVCSAECLGVFASTGAPLEPCHLPGFPPAS